MWISWKKSFFCGWLVDKSSRFFPQGAGDFLTSLSPTCRLTREASPHIYASLRSIHIIHTPYYDYESHILFI